jgi:hypothetical protein
MPKRIFSQIVHWTIIEMIPYWSKKRVSNESVETIVGLIGKTSRWTIILWLDFRIMYLEIFQASSLFVSNQKNVSLIQNSETTVAEWKRQCLPVTQEDPGSNPTWWVKHFFYTFYLKKNVRKNVYKILFCEQKFFMRNIFSRKKFWRRNFCEKTLCRKGS